MVRDLVDLHGGTLAIDYGRCIVCQLCTEACPSEAMVPSGDWAFGVRRRDDLVWRPEAAPATEPERAATASTVAGATPAPETPALTAAATAAGTAASAREALLTATRARAVAEAAARARTADDLASVVETRERFVADINHPDVAGLAYV